MVVVLSAAVRPMTACLFFFAACWWQRWCGGEVVLVSRHPRCPSYYRLRRGRWQHSFIYFLLLLVDNNNDNEARLSLYPATPDACVTVFLFYFNLYWYHHCRTNAPMTTRRRWCLPPPLLFYFFIATRRWWEWGGGEVILVPRRHRRASFLSTAALQMTACPF